MEAGISSFAFGWAVQLRQPPLEGLGLIGFAHRHGLRIVQLGDNLPVHRLPPERRAELLRYAKEAGVRLELGARGLTEAHLQAYLVHCRELETSLLRFVVDTASHEPPLAEITALLRNAAPTLAAAGITLAVENHDRFSAASLRRLVEEVGSPHVGICLDTANSLGAGEGLEHVASLLAPVTVNLHVKDVIIRRLPHQMGFTIHGCTLGEGQLPIRQTVDRLRELGYRGSAVLEAWWPPAADAEETLAGELGSAEAGLRTLKRWLES